MGQQIGQNLYGEVDDEEFGSSVSASNDGSLVAIGSPSANDFMGVVKVFNYTGTQWMQVGSTITGLLEDRFGTSVSLSANGLQLAVGAPSDTSVGQVSVFELNEGEWVLLGSAICPDAKFNNFGSEVSLNGQGTRVAITSKGRKTALSVYQFEEMMWVKVGNAIQYGSSSNSAISVSLSGEGLTAAIGVLDSGWVTILKKNASVWEQMGQVIQGTVGDNFGRSVSINSAGTRVAVGSGDDTEYTQVFDFGSNVWTQVGSTIEGGSVVSLSNDGNRLVIGSRVGSVQVLDFNETEWVLSTDINGQQALDSFGKSVSLSGDGLRVVIGAPTHNNSNLSNSGLTKIYCL